MRKIVVFAVIFAIVFVSGCVRQDKGELMGHVTIGPLCPVEPCDVSPEQLARAYGARRIVVFADDGATMVKEVTIDADGNYRTELERGEYVVDIKSIGIDRSPDVPKSIVIEPGKTITVDIGIDTGIR